MPGQEEKVTDDLKGGPKKGWLFRNRARTTLITMATGNFICALMMSLQAPFFPHEAELKGATPTQYGFVFGVYELMVIISAPFAGKLVAIVPPRFLLCCGMFILGICAVLFGVLNYAPYGRAFLALAFAVRIVEGIGAAAYITTSFTVIASQFQDKVGTTFAVLGSCFGIGIIFGPTVGGALYEAGGYTLPFAIMGSFSVVYSFSTYYLLPEIEPSKKKDLIGVKETFRFWAHYRTLIPTFLCVTTFMTLGFNAAVLEPHIRQFGLSPFYVGLVFIVSGGVYGLTAPLWGWMGDKWVSPKLLCLIGTVLCAIFCVLVGPVSFVPFDTKLWLVIFALVFFGLGSGIKNVCAFAALNKDTKVRGYTENLATNGLISSVFSGSQALGSIIGPSLGGYLFDTIGYRKATVVLFSLEIIMVFVTAVYYLHDRASSKKTKSEPEEVNETSLLIEPEKDVIPESKLELDK